jgi:hypothetical protein
VHWLQAERYLEEVGSHQTGEAVILNHLAGLYAMQDRVAEADRLLARGMAAFEELGVTMTSSVTHPASFVATAEAHLRRDDEGLEAMGEKGYLVTTAAFLAQAIAAQGRPEEAERFIEVSREAAGEDDLSAQMVWQGLQARTDFLNQHGDALLELAVVLDGAGRAAEARVAVSDALDPLRAQGQPPRGRSGPPPPGAARPGLSGPVSGGRPGRARCASGARGRHRGRRPRPARRGCRAR